MMLSALLDDVITRKPMMLSQ